MKPNGTKRNQMEPNEFIGLNQTEPYRQLLPAN